MPLASPTFALSPEDILRRIWANDLKQDAESGRYDSREQFWRIRAGGCVGANRAPYCLVLKSLVRRGRGA